ncbi:MAG: hypothetical protein OJF49_002444 [Ktedonobacterales bacterium]|nr:MAG: hypothetical protein OJF49_002444 [Ktedonobacterales bacterium]
MRCVCIPGHRSSWVNDRDVGHNGEYYPTRDNLRPADTGKRGRESVRITRTTAPDCAE